MGRFVSRIMDQDVAMGITRWFDHDTDEDTFIIRTEQDEQEILELNQLERNEYDERTGWKGDMHRVARLPFVVEENLKKAGCHPTQDQKAFAKWLDRPENQKYRTRPGRMSK